jgi:squalene-hopene/tetraprenyl-beta-curcumene cyclase
MEVADPGSWVRLGRSIVRATERGLAYLQQTQAADGSWVPLWFGNQFDPREANPVYGTARTLLAYRDLGLEASRPARRGAAWLASRQNPDGGWGSGRQTPAIWAERPASGVEETAVAVEALLTAEPAEALKVSVDKGLSWLCQRVEDGRHRECSPIGFYFAKLWYYEKLYPLIFTVSALGHAVRRFVPGSSHHAAFVQLEQTRVF